MPLPFPSTDWRALAVCRDVDGEIFFPVGDPGDPFDPRNTEALACCAVCPVRAQCLAEALVRIPYGVAGGMTADQRRALLARRRRQGAATPRRTPRGPVRSPLAPDPGMTPSRARTRAPGRERRVEGPQSRRANARRRGGDTPPGGRGGARPDVRDRLPEPVPPEDRPLTRARCHRIGARAVS